MKIFPTPAVAPNTPRGSRRVETAILLITFLATVGCATVAFWPEPPPLRLMAAKELRAIGADEMRASQAFQDIWRDLEQGGSPRLAADRIDQEVLPVWRRGRARLDRACESPLAPFIPPYLAEFFRQREIAWTSMSAALRDDDPLKALRARQAWDAANQLAEKVRAAAAPPTR